MEGGARARKLGRCRSFHDSSFSDMGPDPGRFEAGCDACASIFTHFDWRAYKNSRTVACAFWETFQDQIPTTADFEARSKETNPHQGGGGPGEGTWGWDMFGKRRMTGPGQGEEKHRRTSAEFSGSHCRARCPGLRHGV